MKKYTALLVVVMVLFCNYARAQQQQPTPENIARRILHVIPDLPCTRISFGYTDERHDKALLTARAILNAAAGQEETWAHLAEIGHWHAFNAHRDLPWLLAAFAYRESAYRPVARIAHGAEVFRIPFEVRDGRRHLVVSDIGPMQVRAPSAPASACGVHNLIDYGALLHNQTFGYKVGACILTNSVQYYVEPYSRTIHLDKRPRRDQQYYLGAAIRREMAVIERYNWGGHAMYDNPSAVGYGRRIISAFEYFRGDKEEM